MEDVFLAVDREDSILENALPKTYVSNAAVGYGKKKEETAWTHHLFLTRCTLSYMQSII